MASSGQPPFVTADINTVRLTIAVLVVTLVLFTIAGSKTRGQRSVLFCGRCVGVYAPIVMIPLVLGLVWVYLVNKIVPEPYLDEFFHIPQAQAYCRGEFSHWDDKITTPPGLYILSLLSTPIKRTGECSVSSLRMTNVYNTVITAMIAGACRSALENQKSDHGCHCGQYSTFAINTAVNIALFPVLFFFTGLYYTDIASTASVLLAYLNHLNRVKQSNTSIWNDLLVVLLGVTSLFMRQTNVFWVVVYMGGVEAIIAIKSLKPEPAVKPDFKDMPELIRFYLWRYSVGDIHDPSLNLAWPDDLVVCILSIGIAAVFNLGTVLRRISPHLIILALFTVFVLWNGSVVLGDKTNHVATIHLAQMLYIWPLFAFFSAPLFIAPVVRLWEPLYWLVTKAPSVGLPKIQGDKGKIKSKDKRSRGSATQNTSVSQRDPFLKAFVQLGELTVLNTLTLLFACFCVAFLIVHFNTIIHPFTLADNRHYMFYVFRYTIRRGSTIRYRLVPIYLFCAWMCWLTLCGCSIVRLRDTWRGQDTSCPVFVQRESHIKTPFVKHHVTNLLVKVDQNAERLQAAGQSMDKGLCAASVPPATSTVLILLLATALSLITAPLVEPRYFILPWVFWRLLVPAWRVHACRAPYVGDPAPSPLLQRIEDFGRDFDVRALLETGWFLLINAATMYVFLAKPYLWKAEDGTLLDDGRLQRFMW